MTVRMLVHGVPETSAVWSDLAAGLEGDVRTVSLPGFGCDVPAGFDSTMHEYAAWLTARVEAVGEPVDLVGHDWGGILVARLATRPPSNLRSWVTDAPGALSESFAWHDLAQIWLTPGAGEDFWAGLLADRVAAAGLLAGFGLTPEHAAGLIEAADERMVDNILKLYRSSLGLGSEWHVDGPSAVPGMVIAVADDPLASVRVSEEMAARLGASVTVLEHGGHFWPLGASAAGAAALTAFWSTLT